MCVGRNAFGADSLSLGKNQEVCCPTGVFLFLIIKIKTNVSKSLNPVGPQDSNQTLLIFMKGFRSFFKFQPK